MKTILNLKSMLSMAGIIAFITIIGLSMTACDECIHGDESATISISSSDIENGNFVFLALDTTYWGSAVASAGSVAINMKCWKCDEPDFLNGTYGLKIRIDESSAKGSKKKLEGTLSSQHIPAGISTLYLSNFTTIKY